MAPHWWRNAKILRNEIKKEVAAGYSPQGTGSISSIISHEFGHHVENWIDSLPRDIRAQKDTWSIKKYDSLKSGDVSDYATESRREMFAETFAELKHNKKPRAYAKSMRRLLSKIKKIAREDSSS